MITGFRGTDNLAGWQVELMEQNARNQQLEEMNAPDPDKEQRLDAAIHLKRAIENLYGAWQALIDAATAADGLPEADEIELYEEPISEIKSGLMAMQKKIRVGY